MHSQRVIVITGGGSGIGKAAAAAFTSQNDQVVLIGRQEEKLRAAAEELGGGVTWQRADVGHREQVAATVAAIVERHNQIDALVNSAGTSAIGGIRTTHPLE